MGNDFRANDKVILYRNGEIIFEGPWRKRPGDITPETPMDWYLLANVEKNDIVAIIND